MLKLNYIIIGTLPEQQRKYLKENLIEEETKGRKIHVIKLGEGMSPGRMCEGIAPAQESILISGDAGELRTAEKLGMASLGYRPQRISAKEGDKAAFAKETAAITDTLEETAEAFENEGTADMYAEGFEEIGWTFLEHVYERHHHIPWTILETERCIVKEFSMEYLDELFALYSGKGMTDYIEPLYPYEQEMEYQRAYIECMYGFYGYGMWIVCEKGTGKLIGRAGVEHREELGGELELGYAIGVPFQRQGYATEVCRAILAYVESELEILSVSCLIEEGNTVSEHLAEKLGFLFEGTLELDGKNMRKYVRSL